MAAVTRRRMTLLKHLLPPAPLHRIKQRMCLLKCAVN